MEYGLACGIDVGGTKVLGVTLDQTNQVVSTARRPTPRQPDELVDTICDVIADLGGEISSLGIGVPGLVTSTGHILVSPHLVHPEKLQLVATLGSKLEVPVRVENDANAATWGEAVLGAGRGVQDLIVVTLGTGIGAGIVCNGRLVRGRHGFAGEPGHMTINFDGAEHVTGTRGSWELYGSGSALARAVEGALDAERINTPAGAEMLDVYARAVAIGLANMIDLLDPELVLLGGGVSSIGEPLRAAIGTHLDDWLFGYEQRSELRIEMVTLGEPAGAIGAALLGAERPM